MTKRFANLQSRGPARESINWGDPGDYRNRGKAETLVPSTDAKYSKRLPQFRPQVPASTATATASAAHVAPVASTAPKAPAKFAKAIAMDAVREAKETDAMWKKATAKANAIAGFADTPTEPENAVQAAWAKAVERANALNGFGGAA